MARRHFTFPVEGTDCAATLDEADGATGLLIVSGGNETRAGAFGGAARLAANLAAKGYPVFRFDRRGVGDSEGENATYLNSGRDIAAALDSFRSACPHIARVVAFGNCDAATAIILLKSDKIHSQVLANPWIFSSDLPQQEHSAGALKDHYTRRIRDPRQLVRLLRGEVSLGKLWRGMQQMLRPDKAPSLRAQVDALPGPTRILIAKRDRTGRAFLDSWDETDPRLNIHPDADHGFSGAAQSWLEDQLLVALEEADQLDMG